MKKILFAIVLSACFFLTANAQSLISGIRHMENENYTEALNTFNAIAKSDPKNSSVHYYIGEVNYLLENYNEAEKAYRKGLGINTRCAECYVGIGKLELDKGNNAEADKNFQTAVNINKKNATIYGLIGDAYLYSKKPVATKAIDYLSKARDMHPHIATYWTHLGEAYQMTGNSGDAMSSYETAVEKDPSNAEAYIRMARIWSMAMNEKLAIEHLQKAMKLSPNDARPIKDLYELYIREGMYDEVVPLLEKYITLIGTDVDAKVRLVKFLTFQAKDYDRAIMEGEKLIITYPDQYTLHRWLAWSYASKAKLMEDKIEAQKLPADTTITDLYRKAYQHSVALFDAIEKDNTRKAFSEDYEFWALSALKIGLVDEAAHIYRKYIEFEPTKAAEIYGMIAKTYYDSSNYVQAIAYYKRKAAEKPLLLSDEFYLGMSNYYLQNNLGADSVFIHILEVSPDYATGWLMRARIAIRLDTTNTEFLAKPHYEKYIEVVSHDDSRNHKSISDAYEWLGIYYIQISQNQKGKEYFEKALELDPANKEAQEYLKLLNER